MSSYSRELHLCAYEFSLHLNCGNQITPVKGKVLVAQSCPPHWSTMEGSSVHGILQARILQQVAIPFSWDFSYPRDWTQIRLHCRQILYHLSHQKSPEHSSHHSKSKISPMKSQPQQCFIFSQLVQSNGPWWLIFFNVCNVPLTVLTYLSVNWVEIL